MSFEKEINLMDINSVACVRRDENITLGSLDVGDIGEIDRLECGGHLRRRLLDIGLVEGTKVECVGKSPSKDPSAFLVRGAVIALRNSDCHRIILRSKCATVERG